MPRAYQLDLTLEQEAELVRTRDHAAKPYLRERAALLLKIAAGQSIRRVAQTGGLKPHHRDSVCGWVARYQSEGLAGLLVRQGRGRKPASFSRSC
jgi:transposase